MVNPQLFLQTLTFSLNCLELKVMSIYSDSVLSSYHDYLMTVDCDNVIDSVDIVMIWLHQQQLLLTLLTSHSINNAFCQTGHWCGYMIYHVVKHTPAASLQTTSVNHDQHNTPSFSNIETHKPAIVRCKIDNIDTFCCALFIWPQYGQETEELIKCEDLKPTTTSDTIVLII